MRRLAESRPVFHSEADLQHAFAWELHQIAPDFDVRLEVPLRTPIGSTYVDVLARSASMQIGIELKYKTRALQTTITGEEFVLLNQAAQDIGRYDFFKDVSRIESFVAGNPQRIGYALFLTNDSAYWKAPASLTHGYAAFAMNEGRQVSASLAWGENASPGTRRGRETEIAIAGTYALQWKPYSTIDAKSYGLFKYVCVEVRASPVAADRR
jgi:hypothetical protein